MRERLKTPEFPSPLHLARCLGQLTVMYAQEKWQALLDKLDDDPWGEDTAEDQAIHSDLWTRGDDAA